ncbi:AlpA family transcriptional regulator [Billgrantia pellis]|uniref:AlpA family transcriptional regulator n=1 Tax=Billgrantia pellis TaxID=2606936 RepID=A0A7V7KFK3_9GAMM|nr:AlpA family transcriptional regulator [Halomonas pellis]KAA0011163.1 AlpA family transcriptional regulator [Halomonas pellis]
MTNQHDRSYQLERDGKPGGNRLLRRREVEQKTGKSRSAIYEGIKQGTFPPPVSIGRKSVAWLEEEIDSWIAKRIEERNRALGSQSGQERGKHG